MADDWDLYAVVRSCKAAAATTTTTSTTSITTVEKNDCFDNPFFIDGFLNEKNDSLQEMEDIYKESLCANPNAITTTTAAAIASIPVNKEQQKQQAMQRVQNLEFSNITFPIASPQPSRSRKRKNQLSKMVSQMTQEELSTDSWAWRKYGQKPIKGSPYPRNYYKCSTLKGCPARKQVERSPIDPNIYIVSYTGEHTHPRPTHRSSLAGSTRTKFSPPPPIKFSFSDTATIPTNNISTIVAAPNPKPSCSSSSPASGSSFSPSPNTPLMEDMLIPNEFMSEDIFKGFQEISATNGSGNSSTGGGAAVADDLSCSLLSPPWIGSSSAANNTMFRGGGGG